ncbi:hypothetical protein [Tepidibacillus marianensis]|uniref:hypothetical protein n=1 Tax=Tepidibacillus marianensis TaxID=3131995 RepID=UPI0030CC2111
MAKIFAPNKGYTGVIAGVPFHNGIGESEDKWLINWFNEKGYTIEDGKKKEDSKKGSK